MPTKKKAPAKKKPVKQATQMQPPASLPITVQDNKGNEIVRKGGAPIGNQYAKGHGWGRPAKYTDPDELAAKCEEYFRLCDENKEEYTITGLTFHLGFADKQSLQDYGDKQDFSFPIKKALLKIEMKYEKALTGNNVAGSIFALKNMKWKDKNETEITGKDGKDLFKNMNDDELQAVLISLETTTVQQLTNGENE